VQRAEIREFRLCQAARSTERAARPSDRKPDTRCPTGPSHYGRAASAVEQLLIDEEFSAAGVQRPQYGIHRLGDPHDHSARYARPNSNAGSFLPCARTSRGASCSVNRRPARCGRRQARAQPVDAEWLVNGQKVWTSGARESSLGLATVRTDSVAKKHDGITTMAIDMRAPAWRSVRSVRSLETRPSTRCSSRTSSCR